MCGIAGFTTKAKEGVAAKQTVARMVQALAHRGPDGFGVWTSPARNDGRVVTLGHSRLAILDLSDAARQPFHGRDTAVTSGMTIVFNGEIYNYLELRAELMARGHIFYTESDTEVLLTAYAVWGADCLARFRGMYAFAVWDERDAMLFLARDPFGKKPLLYFREGDNLVFASELTALSTHPAFRSELDANAVGQYLLYKYVPGANTLVAGVRELPPGHAATWRDGQLKIYRHYRPPMPERDRSRQLPWNEGTVAQFRAKLKESINLRLRSDVPLGAFLSGGLDSSAIVAIMAESMEQPVHTFSIGFREEPFSELWAARLVAQRFRTDHHELQISPKDLLDNFEIVTARRGAPLSEMADIPLFLLSRLAARHVKVVLSGEGSDELLAGYPKHWGDLAVARYHRVVPRFLDNVLLGGASALLGYRARRLQVLLRAARERNFLDRQGAWFGLMSRADARRLCPNLDCFRKPFNWSEDPNGDVEPLQRALMFDKTVWLPGTLLERGDRLTMAASIEGRMPFMDVELCAFVAQLPTEAFLAGRTGKQILRRAMGNNLPPEILTRPKSGFRVPVHEWLRGPLREFMHDVLITSSIELGPYVDRGVLRELVAEHETGRRNREKELWSLLSLEIFLRIVRQMGYVRDEAA